MSTEFCIVMSTTDSEDESKSLAKSVIELRLAACVQTTVVHSTFDWDDKVSEADEYLMLFKTTNDRAAELKEYLSQNHSYDVPEILEIPITGGGASYLEWMASSTSSTPKIVV
ncbi:MAG: divalent-cation tolerance protein CutA [Subtercola sp.]|nr:divalent-cation tolerance protein CutA [Subtercola sp.]